MPFSNCRLAILTKLFFILVEVNPLLLRQLNKGQPLIYRSEHARSDFRWELKDKKKFLLRIFSRKFHVVTLLLEQFISSYTCIESKRIELCSFMIRIGYDVFH